MIYHHRTVRCPSCNKIAEMTTTTHGLTGSPFRTCQNCGVTYFDSGYKEPGLLIFESKAGDGFPMGAITAAAFTFAAVFLIYQMVIEGAGGSGILFAAIFMAIFAVIFDAGVFVSVKEIIHSDKYHQKQIDRIEGKNGEMPDDLKESMLRLSNREYLDALKAHGVSVPDYFYQRLKS